MTPAEQTPAVIYCRVSTHKQAEKMDALLAQEAECRRVCDYRGWVVVEVVQEVQSGAQDIREGWSHACHVAREHGGVVVVQDTSRMSRSSSIDRLHAIYREALADGYAIYSLDFPEVDLTEPTGELMLSLLAAVNRFQRRMTGKKTSASLRAKVARGEAVGRPRVMPAETVDRIRSLHSRGTSYQRIAETLNAEGVPNASGGAWAKQSVYKTVKRYGVAS
jgi:DNA invertase Pin-like site-specific DNA recombinase